MILNDHVLRENLIDLLRGEQAHAGVERALSGLKPGIRNVRPGTGLHQYGN